MKEKKENQDTMSKTMQTVVTQPQSIWLTDMLPSINKEKYEILQWGILRSFLSYLSLLHLHSTQWILKNVY
jgi:hypothetical protein